MKRFILYLRPRRVLQIQPGVGVSLSAIKFGMTPHDFLRFFVAFYAIL